MPQPSRLTLRQDAGERRLEQHDLLVAVAENLRDGSLTPLLTHFVNSSDISKRDLKSLHSLIDELEQARKSKQKR